MNIEDFVIYLFNIRLKSFFYSMTYGELVHFQAEQINKLVQPVHFDIHCIKFYHFYFLSSGLE